MMPQDWNIKNYGSIRRSVHMILIKVKLASKFEDKEDRITSSFTELLKFTKDDRYWELFPETRFNFFLK